MPPDYNTRALSYHETHRNREFYQYWVHQSLADVVVEPSGVVVEMGCGSGFSTEVYVQHFSGWDVIAVDMSAAMLAHARSNPQLSQVCFHEARAEHLPVASAVADYVVSNFAFHWFDLQAALNAVARILKPGGQTRIVMPSLIRQLPGESGNQLLSQAFRSAYRKHRRKRATSIGLGKDAMVGPVAATGLKLVAMTDIDYVETFSDSDTFWQTLDSRGSIEAIFGLSLGQLPLPEPTREALPLRWRCFVLHLSKPAA